VNVALWVIAGVLAAVFLAAGGMKLGRSKEQLAGSGWWSAQRSPTAAVRRWEWFPPPSSCWCWPSWSP